MRQSHRNEESWKPDPCADTETNIIMEKYCGENQKLFKKNLILSEIEGKLTMGRLQNKMD